REMLYKKLAQYNIDYRWFKAYNDNRLQYVHSRDMSKVITTYRGLCQGGCLSGILFALFINDMHDVISSGESDVVLFVDDSQTMRELESDKLDVDLKKLEIDCNVVVNWFHENDLALNKEKTELIIHCNKS